MNKTAEFLLLKSLVNELLLSEDYDFSGGDYMGMSNYADSPYGLHFGSNEQLYKIFIKPFVDVVETAAGETKKISTRALTLARVAFEAAATTVLPYITDSYKEIFDEEREKINKIKQDYKEVFDRNWKAFTEHDALVAAFVYKPANFLTVQFAKRAPLVVAQLLSVFTGGRLDNVLHKYNLLKHFNISSRRNNDDHGYYNEGLLREEADSDIQTSFKALVNILNDDNVQREINNSQVMKELEVQGKKIINASLKQLVDEATKVLNAKSFNEIQRVIGERIPELAKLASLEAENKQQAETAALKTLKNAVSSFYAKNLEQQVKEAVNSGAPQNSEFVRAYTSVINKVKPS